MSFKVFVDLLYHLSVIELNVHDSSIVQRLVNGFKFTVQHVQFNFA